MVKNVKNLKSIPQKEKEEYASMYQEGKSSSYFERELGISANTIRMRQYKINHSKLNNENKRKKLQKKRKVKILLFSF